MAEKGKEVEQRPPPGQPADEEVQGEFESLEEVSDKISSKRSHGCIDILC